MIRLTAIYGYTHLSKEEH